MASEDGTARHTLRVLRDDFDGQAAAYLRLSDECRTPLVQAALARIADIISAASFALGECADAGTAEPLNQLTSATDDWLNAQALYLPADGLAVDTDGEAVRLDGDGNAGG